MTATQIIIAIICVIVALKTINGIVAGAIGLVYSIYLGITTKEYKIYLFTSIVTFILIVINSIIMYGCFWVFNQYVMPLNF